MRRDGIDLSSLSDGQLWARRTAFERETSWAPPYPAAELQTARKAERDARIAALRAGMEAAVAQTGQLRDTHATLAAAHRLIEDRSREYADRLSAVAGTYAEWEAVTEATRRYALAADAELRRRHPELHIKPLAALQQEPGTAEAAAAADEAVREQVWIQPALDGSPRLPGEPAAPEPGPSEAQAAGGVTGQTELSPDLVAGYEHRAAQAQDKIAELMSLQIPGEDPDVASEPAWQEEIQRDREAVLQPPRPLVAQPAVESSYLDHPYYQHPQPGDDELVKHGPPGTPDVQADVPGGPET
jgi:hypothetical protein